MSFPHNLVRYNKETLLATQYRDWLKTLTDENLEIEIEYAIWRDSIYEKTNKNPKKGRKTVKFNTSVHQTGKKKYDNKKTRHHILKNHKKKVSGKMRKVWKGGTRSKPLLLKKTLRNKMGRK